MTNTTQTEQEKILDGLKRLNTIICRSGGKLAIEVDPLPGYPKPFGKNAKVTIDTVR